MFILKLVSAIAMIAILSMSMGFVGYKLSCQLLDDKSDDINYVDLPWYVRLWYGFVSLYFLLVIIAVPSGDLLLKFMLLVIIFAVIQAFVWSRLMKIFVRNNSTLS